MLARTCPYTTITLDMGYTLVSLDGGYERALIDLAARYGRQLALANVVAAISSAWERQVAIDATTTWTPSLAAEEADSLEIDRRICLTLGLTEPQAHVEANTVARRIFHDPASYRVFPEVFATLEALRRRGLKLGIVSNWGWWLEDLCLDLGLSPYFDFIISSARIGAAKPHPAIFRAALEQAGSEAADTLHVGDTLAADVTGAQAVGITGVLIDRSASRARERVVDGYPVVRRLDQVLDLLPG